MRSVILLNFAFSVHIAQLFGTKNIVKFPLIGAFCQKGFKGYPVPHTSQKDTWKFAADLTKLDQFDQTREIYREQL